jgi:hypothetical protein
MAKNIKIGNIPELKPRESRFTLDKLIITISGIDNKVHGGMNTVSDEAEAILCLANEIAEIKKFLRRDVETRVQD